MGNQQTIVEGQVIETLPNTLFRVKVGEEEILAHLAGKMRLNYIRVLLGDRVVIELGPDRKKGRIIRRL